ncbi:MAG: LamG-like jellyroll fold domain-containing protein [Scytonema sp. PMC 1069.18]|nr:LamG-like jellyroll fold domain-containing protein [Scytonema sp. PMC 1069.18]MEC4881522.1 LamG-like jellyroll fold domain-containing protein [Scytonema sp. PMC 1070.18]
MSEPEILWQIGRPGDGSKEFLTKGAWSEEYDYTVGSDADSINHPSIPGIITAPEARKPSKSISTDKLNIDFTLERDYGQGQLILFYNFYGSEEDSLFLNGELLTKIVGVGEGKLKENEIPLGALAAGKHRLSITTNGGKDGKHSIDYLKLQAIAPTPAPVPISIQQNRKEPSMVKDTQSGQIQSVLNFDGQDDYVEISYTSNFELTNNFTISAWVKTNKLDSVQRIFSKPRAYGFGLTGNQIRFTTYDIRDYDTTQANLAVDTWYHLAVALDNDYDAYFYVNGELIEIVQGNAPANISQAACEIGRKDIGGKEYWYGQISELRFWNKVRTTEEIKADMSRRLVGNEPGLVGYWALAEGEGDVVFDKTPNAQNGTIYGGATWQNSDIPLAALKVVKPVALKTTLQSVLVFDSPDDYVDIDSNSAKLTGNFTIEAWICPTYDPTTIAGANTTDLGKWVIYGECDNILYLEGNELKFQKNAPHEMIASTNNSITLNDWNHVAVVKAGNKAGETKLYINGVQNDNQAVIPRISSTGAKVRIGGQADFSDRFFHGKISEVRLWNRPRSQSEIQRDMYHRLRGNEPGLTDYFPLSEGSGITVKDRTSNPNNGKIYNASWSQSLIPIVDEASAIERLTNSTGLEDYGYWWKRVAKDLLPEETKIPFRRGRIWR